MYFAIKFTTSEIEVCICSLIWILPENVYTVSNTYYNF